MVIFSFWRKDIIIIFKLNGHIICYYKKNNSKKIALFYSLISGVAGNKADRGYWAALFWAHKGRRSQILQQIWVGRYRFCQERGNNFK